MNPFLANYLSIRYKNEEEERYIAGLLQQFFQARDSGAYHLALFAYHLLFICFFYQTFYKIKILLPEKHHLAVVSFDLDRRKKFRESKDPTDYAHTKNHERSIFEFLNIFSDCEVLVRRCKELIDYRNQRLGHVNYLLVSYEAFEKQVVEYDDVVSEIHALTHPELSRLFDEYIKSIDPFLQLTKDEIETDLVVSNNLSNKDLEYFYESIKLQPSHKTISDILINDFGI